VITARAVHYSDAGIALVGWYACPQGARGAPGLLLMPPASGLGPHPKQVVERLAALGYCVLGGDPAGGGRFATRYDEAVPIAESIPVEPLPFRARVQAAFDALLAQPEVDGTRLAALGYCRGGAQVLELARMGAALRAVIAFHATLEPKIAAERGAVKAELLVCTGSEDPFVPAAAVSGFISEMTQAAADFHIMSFPGVKHGFTNPDTYVRDGFGYDAAADARSWDAMVALLARTLR
jgi:dienelactone hydrolase